MGRSQLPPKTWGARKQEVERRRRALKLSVPFLFWLLSGCTDSADAPPETIASRHQTESVPVSGAAPEVTGSAGIEIIAADYRSLTRVEMRDGDRKYLREGWSKLETFNFGDEGELSICWAVGKKSDLTIPIAAASETVLRFRSRTPLLEQEIRVRWNDVQVGSVALPPGQWKTAEIDLPPQLESGEGTLDFDFAVSRQQGADERELAVLFDWIEVVQNSSEVPAARSYKRLGSQIHADVRELSLPGSLSFRIADVPEKATLSFGLSTTPNPDPHAAVVFSLAIAPAGQAAATVFETTLSNVGRRPRVDVARVETVPPTTNADTLSDGNFETHWTAPNSKPPSIRIDLHKPTILTAFSIGTNESAEKAAGIPATIKVALSEDGVSYGNTLVLDHADQPRHQWHLLPQTPTRSITIEIGRTHDGNPVSINEIILTSERVVESLYNDLGQWNRQAVDLADYAGQEIDLLFHFDDLTPEGRSNTRGLISDPRVELFRKPGELNLVLISVDTVRTDRLSAFGYDRQTTPFLEKLVKQPGSASFSNVRSTSTWTPPSHLAMMVGRTPLNFHVNATHDRVLNWRRNRGALAPLDPRVPTLASILRDNGYLTFALSSAGGTMGEIGLQNGFDVYDNPWNLLPTRPLDYFDELVSKVDRVEQWLEEHRDRKFFLFLHTYVAHMPYKAADFASCEESPEDPSDSCREYLRRLNLADNRLRRGGEWGKNRELLRESGVYDAKTMSDLYDSGLPLVDEFLESVLAQLARLELRESTVVVITSDHGEPFGEHHRWHFDGGHGWSLYDEYLRVPLIFLVPGLDAPFSSALPASLVDIVPTALDLLGIESAVTFDGQTLVPALSGEAGDLEQRLIFYEVLSTEQYEDYHFIAASKGPYKILANQYNLADGHHELYDLEADPTEAENIASSNPDIASDLLEEIDRHISGAFAGMVVVDISTLDTPGEISLNGTIAFDQPVRLFEIATRRKTDVVEQTTQGDGSTYEFNLAIENERRLLGFRPSGGEARVFFRTRSNRPCTVSSGSVDQSVRHSFATMTTSEVEVSSVPKQSDRRNSECSVKVYFVQPTKGQLSPPVAASESNQISDEDRERALEQMRALGYIE